MTITSWWTPLTAWWAAGARQRLRTLHPVPGHGRAHHAGHAGDRRPFPGHAAARRSPGPGRVFALRGVFRVPRPGAAGRAAHRVARWSADRDVLRAAHHVGAPVRGGGLPGTAARERLVDPEDTGASPRYAARAVVRHGPRARPGRALPTHHVRSPVRAVGRVARAVPLARRGVPRRGDPRPRPPRVEQSARQPRVGVLVPEVLRAAGPLPATHSHPVGGLSARCTVDVRGGPAGCVSASILPRAPHRRRARWDRAAAAWRAYTRLPCRTKRHREPPGAVLAAGAARDPGAGDARVRCRGRMVRSALVDGGVRGVVDVLLGGERRAARRNAVRVRQEGSRGPPRVAAGAS